MNIKYFGGNICCYSNTKCTITLLGVHTRRGRFCLYKMNIIGLVVGYRRFKGGDESFNIKRDVEKINFKYGNPIRMIQNDVQCLDFLLRGRKLWFILPVNWLRLTG
jgi:hypothetical protein